MFFVLASFAASPRVFSQDAVYDLVGLGLVPEEARAVALLERKGEAGRTCELEPTGIAAISAREPPDEPLKHAWVVATGPGCAGARELFVGIDGLKPGPLPCPTLASEVVSEPREGGEALVLRRGEERTVLVPPATYHAMFPPYARSLDLNRDGHPDYLVSEGIRDSGEPLTSESVRYTSLWLSGPDGTLVRVARTPFTGSL